MYKSTEFQYMKKTLFGNQVQSSVLNDSIVTIVLSYVKAKRPDDITSVEDAVAAVTDVLSNTTSKKDILLEDEYFIRLVAGCQSFYNSRSGDPTLIDVKQPHQDSPKRVFRVVLFGMDL